MKREANLDLKALRVDGGASANGLMMQFQADILQCEVHLPKCLETTALGAAYFAGLGCGFWKCKSDIYANHLVQKQYIPSMPKEEVDELYEGWLEAVKATKAFKPHRKK
jgi:glycerol kinase